LDAFTAGPHVLLPCQKLPGGAVPDPAAADCVGAEHDSEKGSE